MNERLLAARLYLVTPGDPPAGPLDEFLPRVLEAGVDIVQLRDKHREARPLLEFAAVVRRRTAEFGALFFVNDRVDLAIAAEADGVHVGQQDLSAAEARRQMGPQALIGLSTHAPGEILAAASSKETDYIAVGPVYPTPTKPGRPAVGFVSRSVAASTVEVLTAAGGLEAPRRSRVMRTGYLLLPGTGPRVPGVEAIESPP